MNTIPKNLYLVHFIEDDYACNCVSLATTPGERFWIYKIKAASPEEAYKKGVRRARKETDRTFSLNQCRLWSEIPSVKSMLGKGDKQ